MNSLRPERSSFELLAYTVVDEEVHTAADCQAEVAHSKQLAEEENVRKTETEEETVRKTETKEETVRKTETQEETVRKAGTQGEIVRKTETRT